MVDPEVGVGIGTKISVVEEVGTLDVLKAC